MIWLSWRQFRTAAVVTFGALAVVAVVVLVTGLQLRSAYHSTGAATCTSGAECGTVVDSFLSRFQVLAPLLDKVGLLLLPAVTGVFWAAPLVARELDSGTYRLAWTQGVTRTRWLTTKLIVVGLASVAATGLLSLLVTWWFSPLDRLGSNRFEASLFHVRDVAPIGYAVFAFALGVTAGLLTRRTLPAMAVTLVGYIAVRVAEMVWIRPHFMPARTFTTVVEQIGPGIRTRVPRGWVIDQFFTDPRGHTMTNLGISPDSPCFATRTCFAGYHLHVTYQPADRYWAFQWYETALFAGLAAVLIAVSYWWLRRRLT
jgi:hypothetical protein